MDNTIIKFEHVSKEYRLGAIGGGTLRGDLQSFMARIRGKEDPNAMLGAKQYHGNERFLALNDVSFEVKRGEALGIIGHNGAGKSTLLKLLSRVTAPSSGTISYDGRIASMLEVGTGFHPELTGRENVYMNGAILGMTKAEITKKFDDIVRFAEMEQFIDTPVKRYSSGMYVKLAFSVAAHLDSEIMIMDEVLAVGDMAFQKKCLDKMRDAAQKEGRTVLYVSHNMNTIRQLCDRCIVLNKGSIIFNGTPEDAISVYMNRQMTENVHMDFESYYRSPWALMRQKIFLKEATFLNKDNVEFVAGEPMFLNLKWRNVQDVDHVGLRIEIWNLEDVAQATYVLYDFYSGQKDEIAEITLELDVSMLMDAEYKTYFTFFNKDKNGNNFDIECVQGLCFVRNNTNADQKWVWRPKNWGYIQLPSPKIRNK